MSNDGQSNKILRSELGGRFTVRKGAPHHRSRALAVRASTNLSESSLLPVSKKS